MTGVQTCALPILTWASEYCTMQITLTHLPTIIYYALAPTYPPKELVSNTHKSDNKHRFLLLWNIGYSITENVWACGGFQAGPQLADHNVFKLGHFPIVHFKTSNYYSLPYQKVSTFKAWSAVVASIVQNGILKQRCEPTMRFPRVAHFRVFRHLVAHRWKYSQHKNDIL